MGRQESEVAPCGARPDAAASADDLVITRFGERVARDMAAAITALEGCRPHVRTPQALAALNRTVGRLREARHVHALLANPGSGRVALEDAVYALAVSLRKSEPSKRPVQLTFELEPVRASSAVSRVVLLVLAEIVSGLMGGADISDDTIGVRLSLSKGMLELAVSHATTGDRPPCFELAPDTVGLAGAVGAQITRRHAPPAAEWRIKAHPGSE